MNLNNLSSRDIQTINAFKRGEKVDEVAERLSLTVGGVNQRLHRIYDRVGVRDLGAVVYACVQAGLINGPPVKTKPSRALTEEEEFVASALKDGLTYKQIAENARVELGIEGDAKKIHRIVERLRQLFRATKTAELCAILARNTLP